MRQDFQFLTLQRRYEIDALVVVSESPMNSVRAAEAVRLSMGLMTYLDEIGILFTGDAVWAVAGLKPESGTVMADSLGQLEKFLSYGQEVLADGFSCKTRSVVPVLEGIETVDRKKAADVINNAKYVITI